jgi:hypothetical protein
MGDLGREGSEASCLSPKLSADTPGDMATPRSRSSTTGISRAPMIIALAALMIGALAVVLAAAPFRAFELDRFFVPKELALHATALVAAMACLWGAREIVADRVDTVLAAFAALCIVSAIFASNHWLALRGVAVTLSGLAIFWCSRAIGEAGWRRPIIAAVIVACTVAAATSLAQAYGVTSDYFTLSRAPGGTLGNRNFVAHLAAIGSSCARSHRPSSRRRWCSRDRARRGSRCSSWACCSRSRCGARHVAFRTPTRGVASSSSACLRSLASHSRSRSPID